MRYSQVGEANLFFFFYLHECHWNLQDSKKSGKVPRARETEREKARK